MEHSGKFFMRTKMDISTCVEDKSIVIHKVNVVDVIENLIAPGIHNWKEKRERNLWKILSKNKEWELIHPK